MTTEMALLSADELREAWPVLSAEERLEGFRLLATEAAADFFGELPTREQLDMVLALTPTERRARMRDLAPDDAADLVQAAEPEQGAALLGLLDETSRREVTVLMAYAEDAAGGLMNPRFARVRPSMRIDEAIGYLRRQARERVETIYYAYALDAEQHLLGVVSFRQLFQAPAERTVQQVMVTSPVTVPENMDQEAVGRLFAQHGLMALPVVDAEGRMKGIVTMDDIVEVVQEEATEDIQKVGGMEALDAPYFEVEFHRMLRKRAGWLTLLFVGEMLTATAMGWFEKEIARAVLLALFIPLIISSGGNSGSQASTLIIRAMALGEVRLRDWLRVMRREAWAGLALGGLLGCIGMARILLWHAAFGAYGEHYVLVGVTVSLSLVGVVMWGTLSGSMLPFALRRMGLDPASASAPFVATMVDVLGLVIYFSVASLVLRGALL